MPVIKIPNTDSFDMWRQKTELLALEHGDFQRLVVPLSFSISGTVTSFADSLVGVVTNFLTDLTIGSRIRDLITLEERIVIEITSATTARTSVAFTPALSSSVLSTVDIISALNSTFITIGNSQRSILIRAIAMA
jgi:hypothetical protein